MSLPGVLASPGHGSFSEEANLFRSTARMFVEREIMKEIIANRVLEEMP